MTQVVKGFFQKIKDFPTYKHRCEAPQKEFTYLIDVQIDFFTVDVKKHEREKNAKHDKKTVAKYSKSTNMKQLRVHNTNVKELEEYVLQVSFYFVCNFGQFIMSRRQFGTCKI